MSQSSHTIGGPVAAVACVSMTVLREFSLPGRESDGLVLTLFTANLAQDGGEVQVRAGGEEDEAKQVLCHMPAAFYLLVTRQQERAEEE